MAKFAAGTEVKATPDALTVEQVTTLSNNKVANTSFYSATLTNKLILPNGTLADLSQITLVPLKLKEYSERVKGGHSAILVDVDGNPVLYVNTIVHNNDRRS